MFVKSTHSITVILWFIVHRIVTSLSYYLNPQRNIIMPKSTVEQIKERFDNSVERLSNSDIGNTAQMDSVMSMALIAEAAALTTPHAKSVLDVGCGGGEYLMEVLCYVADLHTNLLHLLPSV